MKFKIGQKAWEVEWCSKVLLIKGKNALDLDSAIYHSKVFFDIGHARTYAEKVYPRDFFGLVIITPLEAEDEYDTGEVTGWKVIGEREYYDGPEDK